MYSCLSEHLSTTPIAHCQWPVSYDPTVSAEGCVSVKKGSLINDVHVYHRSSPYPSLQYTLLATQ